MTRSKIFVSSNQTELKEERAAVKEIILSNPTLRNFFELFLFEDTPAKGELPVTSYLKEVDNSDIYIGIIGKEYGVKGKDGLSPTELEFRRFIKKPEKEAMIFIKGRDDSRKDKDIQRFIKTIRESYIYKRFTNLDGLKACVLSSLISYLDGKGKLSKGPFDETICREAGYEAIDEREVKDFLKNRAIKIKVDIPEYPYEAIREAVINAIAHRDYTRRGAPIIISIFDDRVEISNPGGLLPGLDIKNLEGRHETRNKKICSIFHHTMDMEQFGTGISKMKRLTKEHGLYKPELREEGDYFIVRFYGPGDKILDLVPSIPEERQIDLRKLGLNTRQIEVLRLMVNEKKKITITSYAALFNISDKTAKRDMKDLVKTGFVIKVGHIKGAYFESK